MPSIEIDDQVFAHLQRHAIPYVEAPNDTVRRLLQVGPTTERSSASANGSGRIATVAKPVARKRAKANLGALVSAGLLSNGQQLFLHDYQGNRVRGAEATVGGHGIWPSNRQRLYSMSDLAKELLKKEGYQSESVRGPSHWYTHEGKSVTALWEEYLVTEG